MRRKKSRTRSRIVVVIEALLILVNFDFENNSLVFNIHTITTRLNLFGGRQYPVERSLESAETTIAISAFFSVYFYRREI